MRDVAVHPTAEVSSQCAIGEGTRLWHQAQVREGVTIGRHCIIGKNAYIDANVNIGDYVKIQNNASVYHGVRIESGVFIGPHACLTNDRVPRAVNPDGSPKSADDWDVTPTLIQYGASVGAGAVVLAGVTVGRFALVGAGSVVIRDVPAHGLVVGNPARLIGYVCACGRRIPHGDDNGKPPQCAECQRQYQHESKET